MDPTDKKDSLADLVSKRLTLSREYTKPYFDRFMDNYKHYFLRTIDEMVEEDADAYPFYSRLSIPISYQIVETILPRVFNRMPTFSIKTEDPNDEDDEMALKELINYQLNHPYLVDDPIYLRMATGAKECFITGNMWGTVPWITKEINVEEWQPYSPELGLDASWDVIQACKEYGIEPHWKLVKTKKSAIDAPVFSHESVFHVFPDPKKKWVSQMGWSVIERWATKKEIYDMARTSSRDYDSNAMQQFKEMRPMGGQSGSSGYNNYDQELAGIFGSTDFSTRDETQGQYLVHEMRTPNKVTVVINESLTIRHSGNPNGDGKLGLFLMKDIPVPGELYGWGEPDPIKKIEDSMSDQANMRNDSVFYDLMRMYKLNPETLVEGEEFIPEPGTVVQMTDLNGLEPIQKDSTPASSYREYQEWEGIIQNTTGVTDYATGGVDAGMNPTKGGVEALQAAANARFSSKLKLFEQLMIRPIGTDYVQRNLRFFDTPQAVNGEKGKMIITPAQIRRIRGNVHFIVDSGSTESVNKSTDQAKWKFVCDAISNNKAPFNDLAQKSKNIAGKNMLIALDVSPTVAEEIMKREIARQPLNPQEMLNPPTSDPNALIVKGNPAPNGTNEPNAEVIPPNASTTE